MLHYVRGCSYDNTCFILGLDVDAIQINPRRHLDEKKLRQLKASIAQIGLQTPITVRLKGKKAVLVAGLHRLVAMKELGERSIPCFEHNREENESYLWQRSENLYRAELRVLERAEAIDEMRQLIQQKGGQVAPPGGRQPKDIGIKKAARALGLTREEVRRAKAIAGIIAEAKAQARELGLDEIRMPFFRSQSCRRTLSAQQLLQLSRLSVPHAPALRQELLPPQMGNRQPRSRLSKTTKQQIRKEHHRLRRLARTVKWSGRNCA